MSMNFYNTYILPRYLDLVMKNENLKQHRMDVVSEVSGVGLEIGFGSGLNMPYYKNITKLYALDTSNELLAVARKNNLVTQIPIEYLNASTEKIPLPDKSLDFVVSTWTLCSVAHPELALREIFRVLKTGGKFSFVEHGKSPVVSVSVIQNALTPLSKSLAGGCHLNRDMEALVGDASFEIHEIKKFYQKSKPLGFMYKGILTVSK